MQGLVLMNQVHGNRVCVVDANFSGKTVPKCDGLITNDPAVILGVRVADCLPISLMDFKSGVVCLLHAGWRGLEKKIIRNAIKKLINVYKISVKNLTVNIGPHICVNHYEIKADVAYIFNEYDNVLVSKEGKIFLDLSRVAELQLMELGVLRQNIFTDKRCTYEEIGLYSYRKDKTSKRNLITASLNV